MCGRLPVAALSLIFLGALFVWTSKEFGSLAGAVAAVALATSAGWLTYSSFCLTDLPLAVTFSAAVFLATSLLASKSTTRLRLYFVLIGGFIGLGVLAKGLVPIALALPFCWFLRSYVRYWWLAIISCLVVAMPWYALVYARNGYAFVDDFFVKHHLQRLYSAALLHTQPWYYYIPVLLIGLFPWTPIFGIFLFRPAFGDARRQFLLAVSAFGFIFFSATRNKLPHYLLPILPALFVLLGSWFEPSNAERTGFSGSHTERLREIPRGWLVASACLIASFPFIAGILPPILAAGRLSWATLPSLTLVQFVFVALPLLAVVLAPRSQSSLALVACAIIGLMYLKVASYPAIDELVSPRRFWLANASKLTRTCNGGTNRDWLYGLSYYRTADFAECQNGHFDYVIRTVSKGAPVIEPLK